MASVASRGKRRPMAVSLDPDTTASLDIYNVESEHFDAAAALAKYDLDRDETFDASGTVIRAGDAPRRIPRNALRGPET